MGVKKVVENENTDKSTNNTLPSRSCTSNSLTTRKQNRPLILNLKKLLSRARAFLHKIAEWEKSQNVYVTPSLTLLVLWVTYTTVILFIGAQLFGRFGILVALPYGCVIYLSTVALFWLIWRYQRNN